MVKFGKFWYELILRDWYWVLIDIGKEIIESSITVTIDLTSSPSNTFSFIFKSFLVRFDDNLFIKTLSQDYLLKLVKIDNLAHYNPLDLYQLPNLNYTTFVIPKYEIWLNS